MKSSKAIGFGLAFLFFATLLGFIVPSGAAQTTTAQITITAAGTSKFDGRLVPESGSADIEYRFTVAVPDTAPGASAAACPTANVVVSFTNPKKPDYASVTLSPGSAIVTFDTTTRTKEVKTTLHITTSRSAKAFIADTYTVAATAASGASGCTYGPVTTAVPQEASITNDYVPIMEYSPARYIVKTGQNKEVIFPIDITNFGNYQTKVTTTVAQPNKNKLDAVIAPSLTTLNSDLFSKTDVKKTINIAARTPHSNGYTNQLYQFNAQFVATATATGEKITSDTQNISLSVQVQGVYVPGFDFVALVGALGVSLGLVGVIRRRR